MKRASVLTGSSVIRVTIIIGMMTFISLLFASTKMQAQTFAREVQAQLSSAQVGTGSDQTPEVSATLALLLTDKSQRLTSRVIFRGLRLNAECATTGDFTILDSGEATIFEGRWFATTFRNGATLISLEGIGDEPFARRRLKLKLKASTTPSNDSSSVLNGEGSGEIR